MFGMPLDNVCPAFSGDSGIYSPLNRSYIKYLHYHLYHFNHQVQKYYLIELALEVSSATFSINSFCCCYFVFALLFSVVLNLSREMIGRRSYSRRGMIVCNSMGVGDKKLCTKKCKYLSIAAVIQMLSVMIIMAGLSSPAKKTWIPIEFKVNLRFFVLCW